jgi:phenylacetate-CoA ligase
MEGVKRKVMGSYLTKFLYNLKYKGYSEFFSKMKNNVYINYEELKIHQNNDLNKIIKFSFEKVPFYRELSVKLGISFRNIESIEDLTNLPILDKKTVKNNEEKFYAEENRIYKTSSTGGSTGITLKYRIDKECSMYSRAINDRGWGYGGYRPGDHIVIFAGGSLVNTKNFRKRTINFLGNMTPFSSYGVNDEKFFHLYSYLEKRKPKYMYGYVSSIYFFALFLERKHLTLTNPPKSIFTTSEKLFPYQRGKINEVLKTEVFNAYGLNDGGVSAYECECHNGLHIDLERSILEVVDEDGNQLKEGKGRVIATNLHNFAMPLIRYDTGDMAEITHQPCKCGKTTPRLLEVIGRTTDYLKFGDVYIGSPVLTVLMGKLEVELYQIIQDSEDHVVFNLVLPKNSSIKDKENSINHIKSSMNDKVPNVKVDVMFYDSINKIQNKNKHKFIINETLNKAL